jgi:sec-independent protein translocase protein TatC
MTSAAPPDPTPPTSDPPQEEERYLTLSEHLGELRRRLTICVGAVVVGIMVAAYFGNDLILFLKEPGEEASPNFKLIFLEPFENFVVYFRVSLLGGLVLAMPVIVWQVLGFLSPGLRGRERTWLWGTALGAGGLFLTGVLFAYYVALPPALDFLLNFGDDYAEPTIRIGSYMDFVTRLLFWTGVSFEMPIVIMYLARFRVVTTTQLIHWWRLAFVGAFIIAAIVTPSIDPVTQTLVAGPIIILYIIGIGLAFLVQPRRAAQT